MSLFFDASEIVTFAIKIEENGEKFYNHTVQIVGEPEVKQIFKYLAKEEAKHKNTFEELLSKIKKYKPLESYPGEYLAYLQAYVETIIFSNKVIVTTYSFYYD